MTNKKYGERTSIWHAKLKLNNKDLISVALFAMLFIVIAQNGILKYCILALISVILLLGKVRVEADYFKIIYHCLIYIAIGWILSIIRLDVSYNSVKQMLIYLSSGVCAIAIYAHYGKQNPYKLIDNQFFGLMIAYLLMYARYFTLEAFYYESNIFAYIFGVYGLIYFYRKKYFKMLFAILFMLLDHKRIVDFAFAFAFVCLFIVQLCHTKRSRKFINNLGCLLLFIIPILWIWMCYSGNLAKFTVEHNINTMGRLEGVSAWDEALKHYDFSVFYAGKGIGWVLTWLEEGTVSYFYNLHNDFLVAFIELGFIGFIVWVLSFILLIKWVGKQSLKMANLILVLIGFMFINLLTDNIYLYTTFLLPFFIVLLSFIFGETKRPATISVRKYNESTVG